MLARYLLVEMLLLEHMLLATPASLGLMLLASSSMGDQRLVRPALRCLSVLLLLHLLLDLLVDMLSVLAVDLLLVAAVGPAVDLLSVLAGKVPAVVAAVGPAVGLLPVGPADGPTRWQE